MIRINLANGGHKFRGVGAKPLRKPNLRRDSERSNRLNPRSRSKDAYPSSLQTSPGERRGLIIIAVMAFACGLVIGSGYATHRFIHLLAQVSP